MIIDNHIKALEVLEMLPDEYMPEVTFDQVKTKFRELTKICHPDQYMNDPFKKRLFESIFQDKTAAWDFLKDHPWQGKFCDSIYAHYLLEEQKYGNEQYVEQYADGYEDEEEVVDEWPERPLRTKVENVPENKQWYENLKQSLKHSSAEEPMQIEIFLQGATWFTVVIFGLAAWITHSTTPLLGWLVWVPILIGWKVMKVLNAACVYCGAKVKGKFCKNCGKSL